MRVRINLLGMKDIQEFITICEAEGGKNELVCPRNNYRVNACSVLGCLAAMEWDDLWFESEKDFYDKIEKWIVIGADDGNYIHE